MAIAERNFVRDMTTPTRGGDVVLGDDWVAPDNTVTDELQQKRARRGIFSLRASPLTRKIITFNLIALNVLVAGILYLNSSRDSLAVQRGASLVALVRTSIVHDGVARSGSCPRLARTRAGRCYESSDRTILRHQPIARLVY